MEEHPAVLEKWFSAISGAVSAGAGAFVALLRSLIYLNDPEFSVTWFSGASFAFQPPNWIDLVFWVGVGAVMGWGGVRQIGLVRGDRKRALGGAVVSSLTGGALLMIMIASAALEPSALNAGGGAAGRLPLWLWIAGAVLIAPVSLLGALNWARLRRTLPQS